MEDTEFDRGLIGEVFELIAEKGWRGASVAEAARNSGLPLDRARARFPGMCSVLMRFGSLADQAALGEVDQSGSVRDRLFGMIMRRVDFLQTHRSGMLALLRYLPRDPLLTMMLGAASLHSMTWLLEAAGIPATGPVGLVRAKGLLAVWLWTIRAWQRDDTVDLSGTMAALDVALARAEQAAGWLRVGRRDRAAEPDVTDGAGAEDVTADHVKPEETLPEAAVFTPPDAPASPPA